MKPFQVDFDDYLQVYLYKSLVYSCSFKVWGVTYVREKVIIFFTISTYHLLRFYFISGIVLKSLLMLFHFYHKHMK